MHRIGVIIPSSNTTVEKEFSKILLNNDVSLHFTRIHLTDVTINDLSRMEKDVYVAAQLLKDACVELIVFACTSGSLIKGFDYDRQIAEEITNLTGCNAITTSRAVITSLKTLKVRKISLATPYIKDVTDKEIDFLQLHGFEIVKTRFLNIRENIQIGNLSPFCAEEIVKNVDSPNAEAVFISCTNFRTFQVLSSLEKIICKPVVSSNSVTLWAILNILKIQCSPDLGCLFNIRNPDKLV